MKCDRRRANVTDALGKTTNTREQFAVRVLNFMRAVRIDFGEISRRSRAYRGSVYRAAMRKTAYLFRRRVSGNISRASSELLRKRITGTIVHDFSFPNGRATEEATFVTFAAISRDKRCSTSRINAPRDIGSLHLRDGFSSRGKRTFLRAQPERRYAQSAYGLIIKRCLEIAASALHNFVIW